MGDLVSLRDVVRKSRIGAPGMDSGFWMNRLYTWGIQTSRWNHSIHHHHATFWSGVIGYLLLKIELGCSDISTCCQPAHKFMMSSPQNWGTFPVSSVINHNVFSSKLRTCLCHLARSLNLKRALHDYQRCLIWQSPTPQQSASHHEQSANEITGKSKTPLKIAEIRDVGHVSRFNSSLPIAEESNLPMQLQSLRDCMLGCDRDRPGL
jgi:hypothetical protein